MILFLSRTAKLRDRYSSASLCCFSLRSGLADDSDKMVETIDMDWS